jgi:hypothetical protein
MRDVIAFYGQNGQPIRSNLSTKSGSFRPVFPAKTASRQRRESGGSFQRSTASPIRMSIHGSTMIRVLCLRAPHPIELDSLTSDLRRKDMLRFARAS